MRITNDDVSGIRQYDQDNARQNSPALWYGTEALDGTRLPYSGVPLGSVYILRTGGSVAWYQKIADTDATADWVKVAGSGAVSGDLTITGTLTAGDVVSTA